MAEEVDLIQRDLGDRTDLAVCSPLECTFDILDADIAEVARYAIS